MRTNSIIFSILIATLGLGCGPSKQQPTKSDSAQTPPASAPIQSIPAGDDVDIKYVLSFAPPKDTQLNTYFNLAKSSTVLPANLAAAFSSPSKPGAKVVSIPINFKDCDGQINAWYSPDTNDVTFCYEWLAFIASTFQESGVSYSNVDLENEMAFTTFHEFGHGLIANLNIPIVGNEETAADEFATLATILAQNEAASLIDAMADLSIQENTDTNDFSRFFDEHPGDAQRGGDIFCLVYGSDPQKHADMITSGLVLETRADKCADDFPKRANAWSTFINHPKT